MKKYSLPYERVPVRSSPLCLSDHRSCRTTISLWLLFTITGCGGSDSSSATVSRTTIGDTLIVATVPSADPGPSLYSCELDLTIGRLDGPEEYVLMGLTSVSADADGNIYISDQVEGEVRIYDRQGQHIRTFGRRGGGPGEFNSNYWGWFRVRAVEGGRLTVEDLPTLKVFDRQGIYISSFDLMLMQSQDDRLNSSTHGIDWFPEREAVIVQWSWNMPDRVRGESLILLDESLAVQLEVPARYYSQGFYQGDQMGFSLPHSPNFASTTSGNRLLIWGVSSEYRIDMYNLDTDRWKRVLLDIPVEPVTASDIQTFKDEFLGRDWMEGQEGLWEPLLNRARYPTVKPFFTDLIGDDQGQIWVQRYSSITGPDGEEWFRYDLFNDEAEWLGVVELPVTFDYIRDGYGYRLDSEEYPVLERYRLISNADSGVSGG